MEIQNIVLQGQNLRNVQEKQVNLDIDQVFFIDSAINNNYHDHRVDDGHDQECKMQSDNGEQKITQNDSMRRRRWTPEEDQLLKQLVQNYGACKWKIIASHFENRYAKQCSDRWYRHLDPSVKRGKWMVDEDKKLKSLIQKIGIGNWYLISEKVKGRTTHQCQKRWSQYLQPGIIREPWTSDEDQTIIQMQKQIGNKWCEMSKILKGRTRSQIQKRWRKLKRMEDRQNLIKKTEKKRQSSQKNQNSYLQNQQNQLPI